jgi:hypothetical protein
METQNWNAPKRGRPGEITNSDMNFWHENLSLLCNPKHDPAFHRRPLPLTYIYKLVLIPVSPLLSFRVLVPDSCSIFLALSSAYKHRLTVFWIHAAQF